MTGFIGGPLTKEYEARRELVDTTYNGWKNYQTWNVALWIQNDEGLYDMAREYANEYPTNALYLDFVEMLRDSHAIETPDGVAYNDSGLDIPALDAMIRELAS